MPGEQTGAAVTAAAAREKLFSLHRGSNSEGMRGRCTPLHLCAPQPRRGKSAGASVRHAVSTTFKPFSQIY